MGAVRNKATAIFCSHLWGQQAFYSVLGDKNLLSLDLISDLPYEKSHFYGGKESSQTRAPLVSEIICSKDRRIEFLFLFLTPSGKFSSMKGRGVLFG